MVTPLASVNPGLSLDPSLPVKWQVRNYRSPEDKRMTVASTPKLNTNSFPPEEVEDWWLPPRPLSVKDVSKMVNEKDKIQLCQSLPNSRDEKWSTLMEMMPTRGYHNPPFTRDPYLAATPPRIPQEQKEHGKSAVKEVCRRTPYGGLQQAKTICDQQKTENAFKTSSLLPSGQTETT